MRRILDYQIGAPLPGQIGAPLPGQIGAPLAGRIEAEPTGQTGTELTGRIGTQWSDLKGSVVTIGVFDGVHVGHRAILDRTTAWARMEHLPSVLITFSVHPDLVVKGRAPDLLMSLDHRLREVEHAGIDAAVVLFFDDQLRRMSAEDFVERILVRSLRIRGVVLGHDTAIGKDRRGDARLLRQLGDQHGFAVEVVGEIGIDGEVVSSTRIRSALRAGDLKSAGRLLGRTPSVLGRVVHGDGRGRTIGFPTANLDVQSDCLPAQGVYAVIAMVDEEPREGLCNIGARPTFHTGSEPVIEVHVLELDADLYGKTVEVIFLERIRSEQKFDGVQGLVTQIERDRVMAKEIFRRNIGAWRSR